MSSISIWLLLFLSFFLLLHTTNSETEEARHSLVNFFSQLSGSINGPIDSSWGWNISSDPCDGWKGVTCDARSVYVKKVALDGLNFTGKLDATSLCAVETLTMISLKNNGVDGEINEGIGNCRQLTHLLISDNKLSGALPESLSSLRNLKKLDISYNNLSGKLPDLPRISGLTSFLAENNHLIGKIPNFDFSNLQQFNVSNNNFSGPVPDLKGRFTLSSVFGNPGLCGPSLHIECPPTTKIHTVEHVLMYSGYAVLGMIFVIFIAFKYINKNKSNNNKEEEREEVEKPKDLAVDISANMPSTVSSDYKSGVSKPASYYSMSSAESAVMSKSMVVLSSPVVKGLRFEDLLKAPAELLGRGKHGSLYKIILEDGMALVVKRIKDWAISSEDFKQRMQKIDQVRHPNVLPVVAFYCSKQEKLIVYEYQQDGSLSKLLQGAQKDQILDWSSRLNIAASVAESLAFMHRELMDNGIAHGNLKSSNILFNMKMDPCLSEYGLMLQVDNQDYSSLVHSSTDDYKTNAQNNRVRDGAYSTFKVDVYGLGVILLELLTGKLHNNGFNLGGWVHSVVREEWTAEVFDRVLMEEGISEERMVNLLQIALKCINPSPETRPSMNEVANVISAIKDEEERSLVSEV